MHKVMMMLCCLCVVPSVLAAAPYDGSVPLLCAALTIQECGNDSRECDEVGFVIFGACTPLAK
jgi:hypothetical protein